MKTKIRDISEYSNFIKDEDMANIFYAYPNKKIDQSQLCYNINKTLIFKGIDRIPISSFKYYTVMANDTWNLISYKQYGTIELWWLICKLNNIKNAFIMPQPGWVLRILDTEDVNKILRSMRNS